MRTCWYCGASLAGRRPHAVTCGDRCRQRRHRAQPRPVVELDELATYDLDEVLAKLGRADQYPAESGA